MVHTTSRPKGRGGRCSTEATRRGLSEASRSDGGLTEDTAPCWCCGLPEASTRGLPSGGLPEGALRSRGWLAEDASSGGASESRRGRSPRRLAKDTPRGLGLPEDTPCCCCGCGCLPKYPNPSWSW